MGQTKEERRDTSLLQCPIYSPIRKKKTLRRRFPAQDFLSSIFRQFCALLAREKRVASRTSKRYGFSLHLFSPFGAAVSIFLPLPLDPYSLDPSILYCCNPREIESRFFKTNNYFYLSTLQGKGEWEEIFLQSIFSWLGVWQSVLPNHRRHHFPLSATFLPREKEQPASQPSWPTQPRLCCPGQASMVEEGRKEKEGLSLGLTRGDRGPKVAGGTGFDK